MLFYQRANMSSGILKWGIPKTIGFNTNMVGWLGWFGGATIWGNLHTLIKQFRGAPYFQTNPKIGKNAKKNWEYHQPKCRYSSTKTGYWWSQILFSSIVVVTMIPNKCWVLNQCIYIYSNIMWFAEQQGWAIAYPPVNIRGYNVAPPSYKLFYNPINHRYTYHKS